MAVEEAVWQREEAYSTGFGYGFAVPHCQSEHVRDNSLAVVRLRKPVEWGSLDGLPVQMAILIALRAEDKGREHLRIFAELSRLVMNEEFRARLEQAADAFAIYSPGFSKSLSSPPSPPPIHETKLPAPHSACSSSALPLHGADLRNIPP